ncbi:hypothetical protein CIB84_005002, partial [Bambusicola thoracicus]
ETTGFNTPLLRPRVIGEWIGREENDADPLAAEMLQPPIPRSKNEQWDSEDSSSPGGSLKMEPKTKGLKQQQQQHKKLLAAMLSQDSFDSAHSTAPSVTEEDIDNEDDAMELLASLNIKCLVIVTPLKEWQAIYLHYIGGEDKQNLVETAFVHRVCAELVPARFANVVDVYAIWS